LAAKVSTLLLVLLLPWCVSSLSGRPVPRPLQSWGAFKVKNRMGVSTGNWGDKWAGYVLEKRKRLNNHENFMNNDINKAYKKLHGAVDLYEVAAGSTGAAMLGKCIRANEELDPPKILMRCAPGWYPRYEAWYNAQRLAMDAGRSALLSVKKAVAKTTEDLDLNFIDLMCVGPPPNGAHWRKYNSRTIRANVNDIKAVLGKEVEEVGVANIRGGPNLRSAHAALKRQGIKLVALETDFSLVRPGILKDGTMKAAKELDITVFAKSPLHQGLLSGKYTANDAGSGSRAFVFLVPQWRHKVLWNLLPLQAAVAEVAKMVQERRTKEGLKFDRFAKQRAGLTPAQIAAAEDQTFRVTPAQVALQWVIAKGAVPIPSIKHEDHADEILGALGWHLEKDEVELLDNFADVMVPIFPRLRRTGNRQRNYWYYGNFMWDNWMCQWPWINVRSRGVDRPFNPKRAILYLVNIFLPLFLGTTMLTYIIGGSFGIF